MANEKVYVIKITNETGGRKVAENAGGVGGIQNNVESLGSNSYGSLTRGEVDVKGALGAVFTYNQFKSVANNVVEYRVSTVQLRTGSSMAQKQANFWYNNAQKGVNFAENLAKGGFVAGSPGMIAAALMSTVGKVIDYAKEFNTMYLNRELEQNSINIMAQRTTVSSSRTQSGAQI